MTLEEYCKLEICENKIYLNCVDKTSSFSTTSKNPQKAIIARIQSLLPNYTRAEVAKYVRTCLSRNNRREECPNLEEHLKEAKRTILFLEGIIKNQAEYNRKQDERIFNLENPVLPLENVNPFN